MVFNVTEQLQDLEEQWATCEQVPVANPDLVQQQLAKSKVRMPSHMSIILSTIFFSIFNFKNESTFASIFQFQIKKYIRGFSFNK
jgi:hypothetical protein